MERRQFLALGATGLPAVSIIGAAKLLAVGPFRHSPSLPSGMLVETSVISGGTAVQVDTNDFEHGHSTVVSTEAGADTKLADSPVVDEAVANTAFSTEYLIAIFQWTSPSEELRLGGIERHSDGLHVMIEAVQMGGSEARKPASILLRITDTERSPPATVKTETVEIDPILPRL